MRKRIPCDSRMARNRKYFSSAFLKNLVDVGVQTIIVTDIATDGMLSGPAIPSFKKFRKIFPQFSLIVFWWRFLPQRPRKASEEKLSALFWKPSLRKQNLLKNL